MWFKKKPSDEMQLLAELLTQTSAREDLLGVKEARLPSPERLLNDTANFLKYTQESEYKQFAKEAWAHVLLELDALLDPRSTPDQVQNARGAVRASLNLLRKSYQVKKQYEDMTASQNVPSAR